MQVAIFEPNPQTDEVTDCHRTEFSCPTKKPLQSFNNRTVTKYDHQKAFKLTHHKAFKLPRQLNKNFPRVKQYKFYTSNKLDVQL